jgi:RNA polymerase primary sigma factor
MLKRTTRKSSKRLALKPARTKPVREKKAKVKKATAKKSALNEEPPANGNGSSRVQLDVEITAKIKELVLLAQEQGYLTYDDINDALPDEMISPQDLDDIYSKLRAREIEIVESAEARRTKVEPVEVEEVEEETSRLDILDEPDGQNSTAHARTGSGNLPAHRTTRRRSDKNNLSIWFCGEGAYCARGKTSL